VRQQINLYQPVFHAQRTRLSARDAASMLGIVCAVLLLWRMYSGRQVTQLAREVQIVRAQQQRESELAGAAGAARARRGIPATAAIPNMPLKCARRLSFCMASPFLNAFGEANTG